MDRNILVLDTNILLDLIEPGKYTNEIFDKLLNIIIYNAAKIVMPEQVHVEWMRHNERQEVKHEKELGEALEGFYEILSYLENPEEKETINKTLDDLKKYKKRQYRYMYGKRNEKLKGLLIDRDKGFIISQGSITNKLVVDFALAKKAPFFSNELNGEKTKEKLEAADAVIFFTVYENMKLKLLETEKLYFVTNNVKDYSEPSNPSKIHSNLLEYADEIELIFSNNLKGVLDEILKSSNIKEAVQIQYSATERELKDTLRDHFFTECPECGEEVHINADSYIGNEVKAYERTYWLRCRCGNRWSSGDLVND